MTPLSHDCISKLFFFSSVSFDTDTDAVGLFSIVSFSSKGERTAQFEISLHVEDWFFFFFR